MGNTSSEKTCTELSVLSWNIWFGTSQKLDQPELRWNELLNIVVNKNPDLIGLQECTTDFLRVLRDHSTFCETYVAVNERPLCSNYFVMLYKRKNHLKTLKNGTIKLKTTLDRQCEYLDVEKEGAKFRFATVHIESYVTAPNIREIQMGTIFDALLKKNKGELAFLVGDFNFHETDEENKFVEESQFLDTWRVVHEDLDGFTIDSDYNIMNQLFHGKPVDSTKKRIDRILFCKDTESQWKPVHCEVIGNKVFDEVTMHDNTKVSMFPSDHYGLFAKFTNAGVS